MNPAPKSPAPQAPAVHPALRVSQAPAVHVPVPRDTPALATPAPATSAPEAPNPTPLLDAEKLAVYQVALELQALSATLVPPQHRVLRDQMERASLSVVLNIAEGAGRRSRKDKRRFYTMARGSACECAAAVDVLRQRHLAPEGACATARALALRVVQMLTKLDRALL
jgi:four helix bundle protein